MSKRAEERAYEIYPVKGLCPLDEYATPDLDMNENTRSGFICGYERAEKDTIERVLDYLYENLHMRQDEKEEWLDEFKRAMDERE